MSEIRRIRRDNIGTILKQGDMAEVHFSLYDAENGNDSGILNQPAEVVFMQDETVVYTTSGQVDDMYMCKFHVETVLPAGLYHVEFIVNGGIYPSGDKPYFTITKSSRGADVNIINAYGFDEVVNRVISELELQDFSQDKADALYAPKTHTHTEYALKDHGHAEHATLEQRLDDTTAQLAQIVTDLNLVDGADNTATIQEGLDKKGWVRIANPGTYLISQSLKIDSDTFFELYPGVEIKLAPGARNYLLVNKNTVTGNENITVKGGIWNTDYANNPAVGGYQNGHWPGHGIFMHKVNNLKFEDLFNKNAPKYCYMLADIENFIAKNIGFDNNSDGFHFQPPINNCYMENLWGHTDDDMVSFTLGDYINYQVSNVGDFENIHIKHVTCDNVKNVLKLTGSGDNNAYAFRNITLEDVKGTVTSSALLVMDDAMSAGTLAQTKAYGITVKGIKTKGGSNPHIWFVPVADGDILVEDIQCETTGSTVKIGDSTSTLNKVTIKDLKVPSGASRAYEISGVIKNLTIENTDVVGRAGHNLLKLEAKIDKLLLRNVKYYGDSTNSIFISYGASTVVTDFVMDNCYVENVAYMFHISADATIKVINSTFKDPISTPIFVASEKNVRIVGSSNSMTTPKTPFLAGTVKGTCSINDMSWRSAYTQVTPQTSDIFYNVLSASGLPDNPFNIGLVIWDGGKFKNL